MNVKTNEELLAMALNIEHLAHKALKAKSIKKAKKRLVKLVAANELLANYLMDVQSAEDFNHAQAS